METTRTLPNTCPICGIVGAAPISLEIHLREDHACTISDDGRHVKMMSEWQTDANGELFRYAMCHICGENLPLEYHV